MKTLSIFLSICIIYSTTFAENFIYKSNSIPYSITKQIRNKYPNAKFIRVSNKEFKKMRKKGNKITLNGQELILLEDNTNSNIKASSDSCNFISSFPNCSGKDCDVILIIVGVVIVAVLVVSVANLLKIIITNDKDLDKWFKMGMTGSRFNYENSNNQNEHIASLVGVTISSGFIEDDIGLGVIAEIGNLRFDKEEEKKYPNSINGSYGMIGTTFKYFIDNNRNMDLHIDVMAGMSSLPLTKIIGLSRIGLTFNLAETIFMDFNYGFNYLDINKLTDSYIEENRNYNQTLGINFGYIF